MEYIYETHMHTAEISACAVSTAAEQVRSYKLRGYTGVVVTDHFVNGNSTCPKDAPWDERMHHFVVGYEKAKAEGDVCGLDVFFGWEYTINGLDFLTYGLGLDFLLAHPELSQLAIEDYSKLVRSNGGYIAQAHPFREAWYIPCSMAVAPQFLDGVETFNATMPFETNEKALAFAQKHDLPTQAGSDSHNAAGLRYSGIAIEHRANDIFDIIDAIKSRQLKFV